MVGSYQDLQIDVRHMVYGDKAYIRIAIFHKEMDPSGFRINAQIW